MLNKKQQLSKQAAKLWFEKCLEVWGDRCEVCGEKVRQVHHYIPKSRNGLLKYNILNGIPICQRCHWIIHFSPNPAEIHRVIEIIRRNRGKKWRDKIDILEKIHGRSFNTIIWLEEQISKLVASS